MKINVQMSIEEFNSWQLYLKDNIKFREELITELLKGIESIDLPDDMQNFKRNLIDYLRKVTSL